MLVQMWAIASILAGLSCLGAVTAGASDQKKWNIYEKTLSLV